MSSGEALYFSPPKLPLFHLISRSGQLEGDCRFSCPGWNICFYSSLAPGRSDSDLCAQPRASPSPLPCTQSPNIPCLVCAKCETLSAFPLLFWQLSKSLSPPPLLSFPAFSCLQYPEPPTTRAKVLKVVTHGEITKVGARCMTQLECKVLLGSPGWAKSLKLSQEELWNNTRLAASGGLQYRLQFWQESYLV